MAFDFAVAKLRARRVVHSTLGVTAQYQDSSMSIPVDIRARWHNKLARTGDLDSGGWAEVIEGIDRIVFHADEANAIGVQRTGTVTFPSLGGVSFTLEAEESTDGPFTQCWSVARL